MHTHICVEVCYIYIYRKYIGTREQFPMILVGEVGSYLKVAGAPATVVFRTPNILPSIC